MIGSFFSASCGCRYQSEILKATGVYYQHISNHFTTRYERLYSWEINFFPPYKNSQVYFKRSQCSSPLLLLDFSSCAFSNERNSKDLFFFLFFFFFLLQKGKGLWSPIPRLMTHASSTHCLAGQSWMRIRSGLSFLYLYQGIIIDSVLDCGPITWSFIYLFLIKVLKK